MNAILLLHILAVMSLLSDINQNKEMDFICGLVKISYW